MVSSCCPLRRDKGPAQGFTLIELLVVVAIISILAAIAIPNFLEAQVRARVARAKAELAILATAIEAYRTDHDNYPINYHPGVGRIFPASRRLVPLTTPVPYISSLPQEPFENTRQRWYSDNYDYHDSFSNTWREPQPEPSYGTRGAEWKLSCCGPDRVQTWGGPYEINPQDNPGYDYDATNGTVSHGDIVRVGARSPLPGNYMYPDRVFPPLLRP